MTDRMPRTICSVVGNLAAYAFPAILVCMSGLATAQTVPAAGAEHKDLAPHATATIRHTETLSVPQANGATVPVQVELGNWQLSGKNAEIQIPPQGDYIAELRNGEVTTVIGGGQPVVRRGGELWTVKSGQPMVVKITGKRQTTASLRIFSMKPQ